MGRWQRPAGPLNVWKVVDGYEILEDGTKKAVKFSVQEVADTPRRKQEVLDLFRASFLSDEAMCRCLSS